MPIVSERASAISTEEIGDGREKKRREGGWVYMIVSVYGYMYVCVYISAYGYMCVYVCMYMYMDICMYLCVCLYV